MAFLAYCWLVIEIVIIPDGFRKWFYLSFYIHPIFLFVCQIFLWLKFLNKWILVVFFYPLRIICSVGLYVSRFFRDCVVYIFSFTRLSTDVEVIEETENSVVIQSCNQNQIAVLYSCSSIAPAPCKLKLFQVQKDGLVKDTDIEDYSGLDHEEEKIEEPSSCLDKDLGMNRHISSINSTELSSNFDDSSEYSSSTCSSNSPARSLDMNEYPPSICISSSPVVEREVIDHRYHEYQESDAFYKKYTESMRWFDILNYDRTCGISAVLNKQLGDLSPVASDEHLDYSVPYILWNKLTQKKLLRSLESDFEMVYVAQSCLSWEALYYQYTKVKALALSGSNNVVFYGTVFGEFQKFQVLLERFLEDERSEGKRIWNYVRGRFSLKGLLQVPQISGFLEEDGKGEAVSVKEVLKAIERCIQAFGVFVREDSKKPWWKLKSSLWACPPVEDPRDLELLRSLNRRLQKKELCLKDLQGKQRCWFKRAVNPLEESERKEMLFTMIDMKLVSRVLQMSTVSSSQLKWCREKLDNLEFKEGKVFRAFTATLFPAS